jgi:hypothetical protein
MCWDGCSPETAVSMRLDAKVAAYLRRRDKMIQKELSGANGAGRRSGARHAVASDQAPHAADPLGHGRLPARFAQTEEARAGPAGTVVAKATSVRVR